MAGEAPDLSGILGALLSNPSALSGISELLGGIRQGASNTPAQAASEEAPKAAAEAEAIPTMALPAPPPSGRTRERHRLLAALGPYLSPRRRRTLEGAIRLLEIVELFREEKEGGGHV